MIFPLVGALIATPWVLADTLPEPELYLELSEAHVCASGDIIQTNEAATFAAVRPFAQGDPLQMRRLSDQNPSLQWATAGGQSLKPLLRGLGGHRVLSAFQGWRYDNLQGASDHGLDFPLLGVDHAEILLGPNTLALGSDALSGVLYFTDVRPKATLQQQAQGYGGTALTGGQYSLHGPAEGLKPYFLGISHASQAEYRDAKGDTVHGSSGQTTAFRSLWSWGDVAAESGQHRLSITATYRDLGVPEGPRHTADSLDEHEGHDQSVQGLYAALESRWSGKFGQIRSHQGYNRILRIEGEGNEVHLGFALQSVSSTTTLTRSSASGRSTETFGLQALARQLSNVAAAEDQIYPNAEQGFLAGFYHRSFRLKAWEVSGGLRGEWSTFPVWSGMARLAYNPTENSHGQLRLSRGSRAPQLEERFAYGEHIGAGRFEIGDSTLGPEKLLNVDAQWHVQGRYVDLQVGGFYQRYEDFIALNPMLLDGAWVFVYSAAPARLYGTELTLHAHHGSWHAQGMYALVKGQRPNGQALPGVAPNKWSAVIRYQNAEMAIPLMAQVVTEYFEGKTSLAPSEALFWNTNQLPGYLLVHAQVAATFSPAARVELGIDNLLNTAYAHPLSIAQQVGVLEPGRQVRLTFTYQW